mmetsp:Transcript_5630/g.21774  ORF Transcript_5630/g.21774 Transcript_5630/m.21774 type:complete len:375 (-) Transcript_5630:1043-2167(-)
MRIGVCCSAPGRWIAEWKNGTGPASVSNEAAIFVKFTSHSWPTAAPCKYERTDGASSVNCTCAGSQPSSVWASWTTIDCADSATRVDVPGAATGASSGSRRPPLGTSCGEEATRTVKDVLSRCCSSSASPPSSSSAAPCCWTWSSAKRMNGRNRTSVLGSNAANTFARWTLTSVSTPPPSSPLLRVTAHVKHGSCGKGSSSSSEHACCCGADTVHTSSAQWRPSEACCRTATSSIVQMNCELSSVRHRLTFAPVAAKCRTSVPASGLPSVNSCEKSTESSGTSVRSASANSSCRLTAMGGPLLSASSSHTMRPLSSPSSGCKLSRSYWPRMDGTSSAPSGSAPVAGRNSSSSSSQERNSSASSFVAGTGCASSC